MTYTYNQLVSRVNNTLNALNKDTYVPRRYILHILKSKVEFYTAQKLYDKSLYRELNSFKWLECVKMKEVDSSKCGVELSSCDVVSRSRKKLPKLLWSRFGPSVIMVTNIDGSKEYQIITQSYYNTIRKKRGFSKFSGKYAIVNPDGYLYIPDSSVEIVNILLLTFDETCDDLSECADKDSNGCRSYWETEIELPDKLSESIIQETIKEVAMRIQIPEDVNEDNSSVDKGSSQQP